MADVSALIDKVRARGRDLVDSAGAAVVSDLRTSTAYTHRTGYLAESVQDPIPLGGSDTIGVVIHIDAEYASFVDEGTGPHEISPRNGEFLVFEGSDGTVFLRIPPHAPVHHPGTSPTRFASDVFERWGDYLRAAQ